MTEQISIRSKKLFSLGEGVIKNNDGNQIFRIIPVAADTLSFDVVDLNNRIFITCRPASGKLRDKFFDQNEYVFHRDGFERVMSIRKSGFWGFRHVLICEGQEYVIPFFKRSFEFCNNTFSFLNRNKFAISSKNAMTELICVSSFFWYQRTMSGD